MRVRVNKTGHHGHTFGIDDFRAGTGQIADIGGRSNRSELVSFYRKRFRTGLVFIDCENPRIDNDVVWSRLLGGGGSLLGKNGLGG